MKRNLIFVIVMVVVLVLVAGCTIAIGPPYGLQSGIRGHFGPGYSYGGGYGSGYGYGGYYSGRGGYGGRSGYGTRWVPGYQRWVCEGPPPNQKCYWVWEPAHYK